MALLLLLIIIINCGRCYYHYYPSLDLHLHLFVSDSENVLGTNPNDPTTTEGQNAKIAGRKKPRMGVDIKQNYKQNPSKTPFVRLAAFGESGEPRRALPSLPPTPALISGS